MLQRLRAGTAEADRTLAILRRVLPPEIAVEVWSASLRGTTLTAFVQSAAWGTRLRYVIPGLRGSSQRGARRADRRREGEGARETWTKGTFTLSKVNVPLVLVQALAVAAA